MITAAALRISLVIATASVLSLVGGHAALALTEAPLSSAPLSEPTVPEPVATYFSSGLLPRLVDLYGPGKQAGSGIDFGPTPKVGDIHRVFAWTAAFLAGKRTGMPTELTNNWVAPVAVTGRQVGLATIWINPSTDNPELASFDLGPRLVAALAAAPRGDVLLRDDIHSAWFATDGTTLVPLVSGTSGIAMTTTIDAYQRSLPRLAPPAPPASPATNHGLALAGIVLVGVVVLLAVFVLLPGRRKRLRGADVSADAAPEPIVAEPIPVASAPVIRTRSAQSAAKSAVAPEKAKQKQPGGRTPRTRKPSKPTNLP